jgi:hypothetical protein
MGMTLNQSISLLKKKLDRAEQKLFKISKIIASTKETSIKFWTKLRKESHQAYEEARAVYAKYSQMEIPRFYKEHAAKQIKRIKSLSFKPPKDINLTKLMFKNSTKQSVSTIVRDSITTYVIRTQSGEEKFNRLMSMTQQLNITEKELDKLIREEFEKNRSVFNVQKRIQGALLDDALEKKYIVLIDKNGKPINYQLKTYAEMLARTKIREAQTSATVNVALSSGGDLVKVSSHNTETAYDAQFEGKTFSLSGTDPDFPGVIDLPPFHPNCRHVITVTYKEIFDIRGNLEEQSKLSRQSIDLSLKPGGV